MSMSMSTPSGIQGQLLEVTVVACNNLKDTEWISKQDPYVCLEYASSKFRTRTCTDGHKNPTFQEKFVFTLIEGLRELSATVWNSNTLANDDFIGSGRVQLQKVLSQGFDDAAWTLQSKSGRYAGEVRLILHYANANSAKSGGKLNPVHAPTALHYVAPSAYHAPPYTTPPPSAAPYQPTAYPQTPFHSYPPPPTNSSTYPPSPYPPPPQPTAYPPHPYPPAAYPPQTYPPPPAYYPPGHYPGTYPPSY